MAQSSPPIFAVYGSLRSGTTLLRLMLNGHPHVNCPGEADYIFDFLHKTADGNWVCDIDALEGDRIFQYHRADFIPELAPITTPADLVAQLFDDDRIGVMMLHRNLKEILDCFPNLKIIHLLRDPRDVARSSIGMGWASNVYHGAKHWIGTEQDWTSLTAQLPPEQITTLHYETLIEQPEAELKRLSDFLGITFQPEMLDYDQGSTYSKPDTSLTYQWKRKQTPYEVGLIEGRIGPLLQSSNYQPSGHPVITLTGWSAFKLNMQNRLWVWKGRFKRHGLIDPIIEAVTRRLGMPNIARRTKERMNANENAHLK